MIARGRGRLALLTTLGALGLTAVGWGQTLALPPEPVPPYTLARCAIEGVDQAQWDVTPLGTSDGQADGLASPPEPGGDGPHRFAFAAAPGRYKVVAYGLAEGRLVVRTGVVIFAGTAPAPKPDPPAPEPQPEPEPEPGPAPPVPPPGPTPGPTSDLDELGRAYLMSFAAAFRSSAEGVRAGTLTDHNAAVDHVGRERDAARIAFGAAVRAAMDHAIDPQSGRITDPAGYAAVLDQAAAALRVGP